MKLVAAAHHRSQRLAQELRRRYWNCYGSSLDQGCRIESGVSLRLGMFEGTPGTIRTGRNCHLSRGVVLDAWGGSIDIEHEVFLGPYTVIYGHGGVSIGANSLIAMHCTLVAANHEIPTRGVSIRSQPDRRAGIRIGTDVWIGAGAIILAGVNIGDGCVIGAGAVVTRDLAPYSVAVGAPAAAVRERK